MPCELNTEGGFLQMNIQTLGNPIQCGIFLDDRFALVGGKWYLYTTGSGNPCVLNVYNVADDRLEAVLEMPGSLHCWSHALDSRGRLYVAPMDSARLFRYTPQTKAFESLGDVLGCVAAYQPCFDEQDRVYMGMYPTGSVVRFDPEDNTFFDYGAAVPGHRYVRSLAYHKGFLYAGTAAQGARLVKMRASDGAKSVIDPPPGHDPALFDNFYTLTVVEGLLFAYVYYGQERLLLVYDLAAEKWLDTRIPGFGGLYVSPALGGKVFFCVEGHFWFFDISTHETGDTGIPSPENGKGFAVCTHSDGRQELMAVNHSGTLDLMWVDFERGTVGRRPLIARLTGGHLSLHAIAGGPENTLFMGAYMGGRGSIYEENTGEFRSFQVEQTEGIVRGGEGMYLGVYPGGRIYRYEGGETTLLRKIGSEQDRPFVMLYENGMLLIGSIPDYNRLGGALTIYCPKTDEWAVYRNIVPDQSVTGLALRDGLVYGGSGIYGGLGIEPRDTQACIFIWDLAARALVRKAVPDIEGLEAPLDRIGSILFGPDGLLWCAGRSAKEAVIFAVDPLTLAVQKRVILHPDKPLSTWRPTPMCFRGGLLYACIDGVLTFDIEWTNLTYLTREHATLMCFGAGDWLYYSVGPTLKRIQLS